MVVRSFVSFFLSSALVATAHALSPGDRSYHVLTERTGTSGPNGTTNSTCGITLTQNTTAHFDIIYNNNATNTTNDLQALLVTQWDVSHTNESSACNATTSMVLWDDSMVGAFIGSYVPLDAFAMEVVEELMNEVRTNQSSNGIIVESCTTDPEYVGQNMGIIVAPWGMAPQVQNALSTWTNGGCMTTNSTDGSGAEPWKSFSLDLKGPPPQSTSSSTTSTSMLSTSMLSTTSPQATSTTTSTSTASSQPNARALVARGDCSTIQVQSGDSCGSLASRCGISGNQFMQYNTEPNLCSTLAVGQHVCCSAGTLPDFAPKPQANGTCYTYTVQSGDTCSTIASANSLTVTQLSGFNNNTWGFPGCSDLQAQAVICLSTGDPPMPAPIANAVCGPQVPGTAIPANISHAGALASLNPCPLNVCCDIWGQCGNTDDFCTPSKSASGAPGTAAPGENGCVSNCGTDIISSGPPAKVFTVGYFEGFNWQRPCLNMDASTIDTTKWTHLHFGFADISDSYVPSIDSNMTDQWTQFLALQGSQRLLSFGGWAFSTDTTTYQIFRNGVTAANRQTFANNIAAFVQSSGVDGVDFDWEYPGAPDIPGIPAASPQNGQDYLAFLKLLRAALPSGKIISFSAPASYWYLRDYPVAEMAEVVDYIVFMTYDLHGQWDYGNQWSDPGCPAGDCLRSQVNSTETHTSLSMITKAGVPSNKIVVGVTSYGRSFGMTQAGCTGPMCTYVGPESGATPGMCTQTAGYLAQAEIMQILADDPSASTSYDDASESDVMVYNSTQWVSYMSDNTRIARTNTYLGMNFLGTSNWAIDLAAFSASEEESMEPMPNCTAVGNYASIDAILADSSIPAFCVNTYILDVLAANMTGSLADYQNIMNDGYSGKYNAYARQVRSQGYWAWQDIWAKQNDYWNCYQTRSGKNVSTTCTNDITQAGDFYYVLKDQTSFCNMLSNEGLNCAWITTQVMPYHTLGGGIACERYGDCPAGGTMYWPDLDQNFPVLDPSQAITSGLTNYTNFSDWLTDTSILADMFMSPIASSDVVDAASSVVFGLSGSVQAMQQVADVGEQAEEEQRKETILAFVTAFLLIIPGVGEAIDGIDALAAVAQIAKMVDVAGNAALSIYGVVEDPKSAPMAIAGILFGAAGLRDESAWGKAASEARSMSQSIIKSMGETVSESLGKIKTACKECSP